MQISLETITEWCGGKLCGDGTIVVSSFSSDTRNINSGAIFIALKGDRFDGNKFVADAIKAGAVAAIVSDESVLGDTAGIVVEDTQKALGDIAHCYRWQGELIPWLGVTGSNGKSTTRHMLAEILKSKGAVCQPEKNFNNLIGMPLTILKCKESDAFGVVEMGTNAPGEIARLADIAQPTVAIVTNVAPAHLEGLGSLEGVAKEKATIFNRLPDDGLGIYPSQVDCSHIFEEALHGKPSITFAVEAYGDFVAEHVVCTNEGSEFIVNNVRFKLPLLGKHNVSNALAAILAARHVGVTLEESAEILAEVSTLPERLQIIDTAGYTIIDDCYNANPYSLHAAVRTLCHFKDRRKVIVIGDMLELGEGSGALHAELGGWIAKTSVDVVLAVGKETLALAEAAHSQNARQSIRHYRSVQSLMGHLKEVIKDDDVVLVKGSRSMRLERVVGALKVV